MKRWWWLLGLIVCCNLAPGEYRVTCDSEQTTVTVGEDGTLAADCDRLSIARIADGPSVACKERGR